MKDKRMTRDTSIKCFTTHSQPLLSFNLQLEESFIELWTRVKECIEVDEIAPINWSSRNYHTLTKFKVNHTIPNALVWHIWYYNSPRAFPLITSRSSVCNNIDSLTFEVCQSFKCTCHSSFHRLVLDTHVTVQSNPRKTWTRLYEWMKSK